MSILIKNRWPADSKLYLQCSGVEHEFGPNNKYWMIEGEELQRVLGPFNQGQLTVGAYTDNNYNCYFTVRDGQEYTLEVADTP